MSIAYLILNLIILIINFIYIPQNIVAQSFCAISLLVLFYYFRSDIKKLLFYSCLIFALVNSYVFINAPGKSTYLYYLPLSLYFSYIMIKSRFSIIYNFFKKFNYYKIFLLVFVLYLPISVFLSSDRSGSLNALKAYFISILLCLMVIVQTNNLDSVKDSLNVMKYPSIGILLLSIMEVCGISLGFHNHYSDLNISNIEFPLIKRVPSAFFYNPNNFSVFLFIGIMIIFVCILTVKNNTKKISLYLLFSIMYMILLFTMSRITWITIFIAFGFSLILFLIQKSKNNFIKTTTLIFTSLLILFTLNGINSTKSYIGQMNISSKESTVQIGQQGSANVRVTIIYDIVRSVVYGKNYFGFGPGGSSRYVESQNNTNGVFSIHSLWFEVLGDYGILIFVMFIIYYLLLIYDTIGRPLFSAKNITSYQLFFGIMAISLIFLLFSPSTVVNFPLYWIIFGYITKFAVINKEV